MAAPAIRGSVNSAQRANNNNPTITSPSTTQVGDLVIVALHTMTVTGEAITQTLQSGWTEAIGQFTNEGSNDARMGIAWTIATTAGAQSYQPYTLTGADDSVIGMLVISAGTFDSFNPIHVKAVVEDTGTTAPNPPSVTTTLADCLMLAVASWHYISGNVTATAPTGYTMQSNDAISVLVAMATKEKAVAGIEDPDSFGDDVAPLNTRAATIAIAPFIDSPYRDEVFADSPVAYWRLGEASGTTANDETTNNLDGAYNGLPTLGAASLLTNDANTAVTFDNTDDYVNVPDNALLDFGSGSFSVECWFKRTTTSDWGALVSKRANTGATQGWYVAVDNTGDDLHFECRDGTNFTECVVDITSYLDGNPHHLVCTRNGSTGDMHIWIDGVNVASTLGGTVRNVDNATALRIGRLDEASTFFNGTIDEVAVYSAALTQTRIQAHYNTGKNITPGTGFTGWGVPL